MRNSIFGTQIALTVLAEHLALNGNFAEHGLVTRSQPALKLILLISLPWVKRDIKKGCVANDLN